MIGLGNPILSDDGAGIVAARKICEMVNNCGIADVVELSAGGIRVLDAMRGYRMVHIIDAMVTGKYEPGTILRMKPEESGGTRNSVSVHDMSLSTAIELGRMIGFEMPDEIVVWGIEASDVETFGETLDVRVAEAIPGLTSLVIGECRHFAEQTVGREHLIKVGLLS